jgi:integral membrane protein (TIGR01906 family)
VGTFTRRAAGVAIGISTALVIAGASVLAFLNPIWVGFEQERTGADRLTGYTLDDVHRVTNAVLGELIVGPATFLQQVGATNVFDPKEREHLADVHNVMLLFYGLVIVALVVLVIAAFRMRDLALLWRAVGYGSGVLAIAVLIIGPLFALFFDTAFDIFHRLFFASGSYTFDPLTERLVQLFPDQFWSETSIALGVVLLVISGATAFFALQRADTVAARVVADSTPPAPVAREPAG